ncbi:uncharacterized protein LOC127265901 [Andrographis paniculata]|uniref:uncharacterized protein LOC127265901 n=1 Tax=Andrographis paniculata TaxID=175694 RepID=UPI0021E77D32|nr:uncharacterized protein LOC127265901 [Andrographis paniculata]
MSWVSHNVESFSKLQGNLIAVIKLFQGIENQPKRREVKERLFVLQRSSIITLAKGMQCLKSTCIENAQFQISRPIWNNDRSLLFDGKIEIFPFTEKVPEMRSRDNRVAGTLETKPIQSITKEVIRSCLINQIIPAIKEKWPHKKSKHIFIQQDNAKPHIKGDDAEFINAATTDGFHIVLIQQPPNSPDMNVNDLGWFRAIQSLQT